MDRQISYRMLYMSGMLIGAIFGIGNGKAFAGEIISYSSLEKSIGNVASPQNEVRENLLGESGLEKLFLVLSKSKELSALCKSNDEVLFLEMTRQSTSPMVCLTGLSLLHHMNSNLFGEALLDALILYQEKPMSYQLIMCVKTHQWKGSDRGLAFRILSRPEVNPGTIHYALVALGLDFVKQSTKEDFALSSLNVKAAVLDFAYDYICSTNPSIKEDLDRSIVEMEHLPGFPRLCFLNLSNKIGITLSDEVKIRYLAGIFSDASESFDPIGVIVYNEELTRFVKINIQGIAQGIIDKEKRKRTVDFFEK